MATITEFKISEFPKADGLFSCKIGGAYVLTKCATAEELNTKLMSGEFSLTPTKTGNSLWAGPIQNVDIEALKPFLKQRRTLSHALATVFPQDVKAAAAF